VKLNLTSVLRTIGFTLLHISLSTQNAVYKTGERFWSSYRISPPPPILRFAGSKNVKLENGMRAEIVTVR
jgi:hypothetical protein